jgi:GH15 family glucan-1,4-alpha-glucosidase
MPRIDSPSCFGRLLDWDKGGYCSIQPTGNDYSSFRSYVAGSLVLQTTFMSGGGEARVTDCFLIDKDHEGEGRHRLLRLIEGIRGRVDLKIDIAPRFGYGEVKPWLRHQGIGVYAAIGGPNGLLIASDVELTMPDRHAVAGCVSVRAQNRVRLLLEFRHPPQLDGESDIIPAQSDLDEALETTIGWWKDWSKKAHLEGPDGPAAVRSAVALKGLVNSSSGAIAAAATTSLPEAPGGERNWDYRFSWIRDSSFSVRSLVEIGCYREASGFRHFIERSAAGSAENLQIMYGVGGERRLTEIELEDLEGYCGSKPVRIGNAAYTQKQFDCYGELVELTWQWHRRGRSPDDAYWRFIVDLVNTAAEIWSGPDRGIWEIRGEPQHFVQSKVMCWLAVDRGVKLAEECMRSAPVGRWRKTAAEIRERVERDGYDKDRGVFVQAFGRKNLDASLLLLPIFGFVDFNDERMVRTVDAIVNDLVSDGLVLRYRPEETGDGLKGTEGTFLACTFWLAECLARQGRVDQAREFFDRAAATGNDLGLLSEEFDPKSGQMLGNFPQGLSHLSHIAAAIALSDAQGFSIHAQPVGSEQRS